MSEHGCWGLLWNTWEVSLRLHKYGFVLLNRLRIAIIAISSNHKTVKSWEMCKNGFHSKHHWKYIVAHPYSIDCTQSQIPKSFPDHRRKNFDFIFIGSKVTAQNRWRVPNLLWAIALRHLTRRKKCDDMMWWYLTSSCRELSDDI